MHMSPLCKVHRWGQKNNNGCPHITHLYLPHQCVWDNRISPLCPSVSKLALSWMSKVHYLDTNIHSIVTITNFQCLSPIIFQNTKNPIWGPSYCCHFPSAIVTVEWMQVYSIHLHVPRKKDFQARGGYFHIFGVAGVRQDRVSSWKKIP